MHDRWKILDAHDHTRHAAGRVNADPQGEFHFEVRHLTAGKSQGVTLVTLANRECQVTVIPTRGMGIWQAAVGEWRIGWNSPTRGPVHPQFVPLMEPGGIGWLDGFDELLVRCGLASNGAPVFDNAGRLQLPLHGRIANIPAHSVTVEYDPEAHELRVIGVVEESRLFHGKLRLTSTLTLPAGATTFRVSDEVTNFSAEPGGMQLLYHVNFGPPLLEPGSRVTAPFDEFAPRDARAAEGVAHWNEIHAGQPGFAEQVYFFKPRPDEHGMCQALLRNAECTRGVSLRFSPRQLPCFALWKSLQDPADGYVTGLEPATNFPNPRPFEESQGRVIPLAPGEIRTFELHFGLHASRGEIQSLETALQDRHAAGEAMMHAEPNQNWSA